MAASQEGMHKADFLTSLGLLAFGIAIVVLSIRMPRLEHRGINPYTIPGLVPALLGAAIVIMSGMLLVRAIMERGYSLNLTKGRIGEIAGLPQVRRVLVTLLVCLIYALGLIGRLWYPASTFLFVFVFIALFEYPAHMRTHGRTRQLITAGIEAFFTATIVSVVFRYLFLVRLP